MFGAKTFSTATSLIPKALLNFGGLDDPQERSDLMAFLKAQTR